MKYGLLVTSPVSDYKNIGDYVQSLAALQFMPRVDNYVEKEKVSSEIAADEPVKTIMNAWYMWNPQNWPPNDQIEPLLTSVHMSPLTADEMVAGRKKNYLIQHGPIGCRDLATLAFLESKNIPAYFSGCLTLTLGRRYKSNHKRSGLVFVDPYISPLRDKLEGKFVYYFQNIIKSISYFFKAPLTIVRLSKKKYFHGRFFFMKYYNASMFYNSYRSKFAKEALLSATYLSHMVPVKDGETQENLLSTSERLINIYAKAAIVVTSRIHCGLPCLGLETPVIFILNDKMNSKKNLFNAPGRFDGILNFFRVMNYSTDELTTNDDTLVGLGEINQDSVFRNKDEHIEYRDKLIAQCVNFMNDKDIYKKS